MNSFTSRILFGLLFLVSLAQQSNAEYFSYAPPGVLIPGSGVGKVDYTVHAPGIRFPVEVGPVYANSQVWRPGGFYGGGGSSSDPSNFKYPWQDNFCETRGASWSTPECPNQNGGHHQGQDNRPPTYADKTYWAVASTGGTISYQPGDYSVELKENSQSIFRYLHLDPTVGPNGLISSGTTVSSGQRIGKISNWFGGEPTTIHLHFDIQKFVPSIGKTTWVSPYMSLVRSYENLIGYQGYTINQSVKVVGVGTGFLPVHGPSVCDPVVGYRGETSVAVVLDGPVTCSGEVRWKVRFTDCLEGWVSGEWLKSSGCLGALVNPRNGDSISFPAQLTAGWTGDCRNATLMFSNGQHAAGFSISAFYDQSMTEEYWNNSILSKIGTASDYYWSVGESFCGTFFARTEWQSFRTTTACAASAARSGGFARVGGQCGGFSPTAMPTLTPTRTWTSMSGVPSFTPVPSSTRTQAPTWTTVPTQVITGTPTQTGTPTPTAGSLVFSDDFNRSDAAVAGNGWRNVHPSIFLQGNRLVGAGVVTRDFPFQFPIRVRARLWPGGCGSEGGTTNHFDHKLSVMTDQYGSGGYGLYFFRADQNQSTSQIILLNGDVFTDRVYSPVEFVDMLDVDYRIFVDGSIRGVIKTQGQEVPFFFPPRAVDMRGSSLALRLYENCPENFLAFDDFVVEAVAQPTASPTRSSIATSTSTVLSAGTVTPTRTLVPTSTLTATLVPTATKTATPTLTPGGSCYQPHLGVGCDDKECEVKICVSTVDPSCCGLATSSSGWDASCVAAANFFCKATRTPTTIVTVAFTHTATPFVVSTDTPIPSETPTATATLAAIWTLVLTPSPTPTATETPYATFGCAVQPMTECTFFDHALLRLRKNLLGEKLLWRGARSDVSEVQLFGDPVSSTDYAFCLYREESGFLVLRGAAKAGQNWRLRGGGFSYVGGKSRQMMRVSLARYSSGDRFRVRMKIQEDGIGEGEDSRLTFQIQNSEGSCWTSVFTQPLRTDFSGRFSVFSETGTRSCVP